MVLFTLVGEPILLHGQRVLRHGAVRLADDAGTEVVQNDRLHEGLEGGAVDGVLKGDVPLLPRLGELDLGEVAMEVGGVLRAQTVGFPILCSMWCSTIPSVAESGIQYFIILSCPKCTVKKQQM